MMEVLWRKNGEHAMQLTGGGYWHGRSEEDSAMGNSVGLPAALAKPWYSP
jgi:hypothetical protein